MSVALEPFFGFGSSASSKCMDASIAWAIASFSISRRGFAPIFLGAGAFFCFLLLGGVTERSEASCSEASEADSSSSVSSFGRFFEAAGLAFDVVCVVFFGAAFGAAGSFLGRPFGADLGAALAFGFGFCQSYDQQG